MENESIVEIQGLNKTYGSLQALKDVSFTLQRGKIYGFIGENGAGKTTCIRVLAGLTQPDSGRVRVLGQDYPQEAQEARARMGFMVERPIYYDNLTAAQNLDLQMQLYGADYQAEIPQLIERVGLKNIEKRKLKDFSLGMKQRLGIAMTLANKPDLLVLDEPVNGLDPVGMVDVRHILQKLNQEGMTIFLSSHVLAELYQLASDYIIIHQGQILRCLSLSELNEACQKSINVIASDADLLQQQISNQFPEARIAREDAHTLKIFSEHVEPAQIGQIAADNQLVLSKLSFEGDDLETFYIKTISGGHNE